MGEFRNRNLIRSQFQVLKVRICHLQNFLKRHCIKLHCAMSTVAFDHPNAVADHVDNNSACRTVHAQHRYSFSIASASATSRKGAVDVLAKTQRGGNRSARVSVLKRGAAVS